MPIITSRATTGPVTATGAVRPADARGAFVEPAWRISPTTLWSWGERINRSRNVDHAISLCLIHQIMNNGDLRQDERFCRAVTGISTMNPIARAPNPFPVRGSFFNIRDRAAILRVEELVLLWLVADLFPVIAVHGSGFYPHSPLPGPNLAPASRKRMKNPSNAGAGVGRCRKC